MSLKSFSQYISENSSARKRLVDLGMADPDPLSITLAEFKKLLNEEYKDYLASINHQDDWMDNWEFYSQNARQWEIEYGITRNDDGQLEYMSSNTNYVEEDDDDDDDFGYGY